MRKTNKALFAYNIFNALTTPSFYIICILYVLLVPINFFIRHQFFTTGTTDLTLFFSDVPYICILFIPALCYRQLFSVYENFVPVKNIYKISIKFLAIFTQFVVMNVLLLPSVLLINLFGSIDAGQLCISFVILLCYGAAVISLCIFIGEVLSNKVSAFVTQAFILAVLNSAHLFAVYVSLGNALTGFFKQISFAWHFDAAGKGVLDTRDFVWLCGSTALFLLLSDLVTSHKKGRKRDFLGGAHSAGIFLVIVLVMLNGTRWYARIDFSENKTFSLSDYSKELIKKIDAPVKITYFRSQRLSVLYPQVRDVSDFLLAYTSSSKKMHIAIRNPDGNESLTNLLQNYGIQSQPLRSVSGNSTEYTSVYSAIVMEYNGNVEIIPFTVDAYSLEYDLDGRLKHLLSGNQRTVNIVVGNGMSIYDDYNYVIPWLSSQGFSCNVLDFTQGDFSSSLLQSSGPLFVIGDSELPVGAAVAIEDYILQGRGNALFAVSPYSAAIEDNWNITENKRTNIVELAEHWGVGFEDRIAADISCARITMFSDDNSDTRVLNYPMWISVLAQENSRTGMNLFWPVPLALSQNAEPYLVTSPVSYSYGIDRSVKESLVETNPFLLAQSDSSNLPHGTQIVAAKVSGALEGLFTMNTAENATVVVIPDQYFVNTLMQQYLGEGDDFRNFHFLTNVLLKLNGEDELAELNERATRNSSLYKITDYEQFLGRRNVLFLVCFAFVPLLVIMAAALFLTGLFRKIKKVSV